MSMLADINGFKKAVKTFFPKNRLTFNFNDEKIKLEISDRGDDADITFTKLIELYNFLFEH